MSTYDIVLLTDSRYVAPKKPGWYEQNVLTEDKLVAIALENIGLKVWRTNWDNPDFDWAETRFALFRTTWDYFDRFTEFSIWLEKASQCTHFINPVEMIKWNINKFYLCDLEDKGINIPPTVFIHTGDTRSLQELAQIHNWPEIILKPAVSGAARHTYRFTQESIHKHEDIYTTLIQNEDMLLQEFQHNIFEKGEVAFMVFGGKFSHAVLKKGKPGDFRVQDDFGGTVHHYSPSIEEILFAEKVVASCDPPPVYARVDVIWDNDGNPSLSELELIEPELWFRLHKPSATAMANAIAHYCIQSEK
ncbi:MAG: hypothetical protein RIG77_15025 [Cyclobacteriaceae bacterium]